jgi:hypothetical protein
VAAAGIGIGIGGAGDEKELVGAAAAYVPDGISERMVVAEFSEFTRLVEAVEAVFDGVFGVPRGTGVVAVLFSVVLSRGMRAGSGAGGSASAGGSGAELVGGVETDMDSWAGGENQLIGGHNYATQALVSLMLTGRARSNVFDGDKRLGDGADVVVLRGIDSKSDCGLLSLFEHYQQMQVGERLKHPSVPVWIVCSESHYTVLWGSDAELIADGGDGDRDIELFYWDGLAKAEQEIRFTVTPRSALQTLRDAEEDEADGVNSNDSSTGVSAAGGSSAGFGFGGGDGGSLRGLLAELSGPATAGAAAGGGRAGGGDPEEMEDGAPPLNLVLRTRWQGCRVSWNGVDPWL